MPSPLSEEQKQNYQKDLDRFEEEKFAATNSFPTKLLGWMLIASLGLQIAGAISGNSFDLGGVLLLFLGMAVLRGSQTALRIAAFFAVPASVIGTLHVIWSIVFNEPLEVGNEWKSYHDLKFWTMVVSPTMYFAAKSMVAICALRLRKVTFWTKAVKWCSCIVGISLMIQLGLFAKSMILRSEVRNALEKEISAAKAHVTTYFGRTGSSAFVMSPEQRFGEIPRIRSVSWKSSPNSTTVIYHQPGGATMPTGKHVDHSEWLRLPSGEWGKLEMEVILPKAP
ncbi:hypothetical protein OKA04_16930 [Luteolibacter flavescens]|uniref:Yip1 domain-containing protein n=1 Tax=Luteolibacter flavescens TaxID=1859460 RepID=A0ABT3FS83_9BACT|nr:hypothetical protein [Luteolibacter flavescens]MCW1886425.1 hypothetical protein [Luteolibacter flavescens]